MPVPMYQPKRLAFLVSHVKVLPVQLEKSTAKPQPWLEPLTPVGSGAAHGAMPFFRYHVLPSKVRVMPLVSPVGFGL